MMLITEYLTNLERCMEKQYFARVEKDPFKSNMFFKSYPMIKLSPYEMLAKRACEVSNQ